MTTVVTVPQPWKNALSILLLALNVITTQAGGRQRNKRVLPSHTGVPTL